MPEILENAENDLTTQMRNLLELLWDEWKMVEQQIGVLSHELELIADADAGCSRIQEIPGIGPVVATAIVAAIGYGAAFRKDREFAAWLELVPRQYSTGGKARLLGISKCRNTYLRKILVHGAPCRCSAHQARSSTHRSMDGCPRTKGSSQCTHRCILPISWQELRGPCCLAVNHTVHALLL